MSLFIASPTLALLFTLKSFSPAARNPETPVSVIGTGDVMPGSNYPSEARLPPHDGKHLFRDARQILREADVAFGNLEGCFLDDGGTVKPCKSKCYYFRIPDRYAEHLIDAGYNLINLANNHLGDFGAPGRLNTMKVLNQVGIHYAGLEDACETAVFELRGVKFGFCGFAPNAGAVKLLDLDRARQIVSALDAECDIVIVSFHGGAEGKEHNRVTRDTELYHEENRGNVHLFARAVVDAGADIVFGHGPHVVRAVELYRDRFIAYSLGNFCTSGEFNIEGICGYAPAIKVFTDRRGRFLNGKIFSFRQRDRTGPVVDPSNAAAREIKRLTELDFPDTELSFSDDGAIERMSRDDRPEIGPPRPTLNESQFVRDTLEISSLKIIDYSKRYLNYPYRSGSRGPEYFDCSGFTHFVFKKFGYTLSSDCASQLKEGTRIHRKDLKTGDLIFFKGRDMDSEHVGHVGIVLSNDRNGNITFIHACRRGVIIDELNKSDYYNNRYLIGMRIGYGGKL